MANIKIQNIDELNGEYKKFANDINLKKDYIASMQKYFKAETQKFIDKATKNLDDAQDIRKSVFSNIASAKSVDDIESLLDRIDEAKELEKKANVNQLKAQTMEKIGIVILDVANIGPNVTNGVKGVGSKMWATSKNAVTKFKDNWKKLRKNTLESIRDKVEEALNKMDDKASENKLAGEAESNDLKDSSTDTSDSQSKDVISDDKDTITEQDLEAIEESMVDAKVDQVFDYVTLLCHKNGWEIEDWMVSKGYKLPDNVQDLETCLKAQLKQEVKEAGDSFEEYFEKIKENDLITSELTKEDNKPNDAISIDGNFQEETETKLGDIEKPLPDEEIDDKENDNFINPIIMAGVDEQLNYIKKDVCESHGMSLEDWMISQGYQMPKDGETLEDCLRNQLVNSMIQSKTESSLENKTDSVDNKDDVEIQNLDEANDLDFANSSDVKEEVQAEETSEKTAEDDRDQEIMDLDPVNDYEYNEQESLSNLDANITDSSQEAHVIEDEKQDLDKTEEFDFSSLFDAKEEEAQAEDDYEQEIIDLDPVNDYEYNEPESLSNSEVNIADGLQEAHAIEDEKQDDQDLLDTEKQNFDEANDLDFTNSSDVKEEMQAEETSEKATENAYDQEIMDLNAVNNYEYNELENHLDSDATSTYEIEQDAIMKAISRLSKEDALKAMEYINSLNNEEAKVSEQTMSM